jgi:glutaredoxin
MRIAITLVALLLLLATGGCASLPTGAEVVIRPPRQGTALIYTRSGCPFCHQAKEYLTARGVAVEERDISADPVARRELAALYETRLTGEKPLVPVILLGSRIVVGFDNEELAEALSSWQVPQRETGNER